jgi:hypothetical protein
MGQGEAPQCELRERLWRGPCPLGTKRITGCRHERRRRRSPFGSTRQKFEGRFEFLNFCLAACRLPVIRRSCRDGERQKSRPSGRVEQGTGRKEADARVGRSILFMSGFFGWSGHADEPGLRASLPTPTPPLGYLTKVIFYWKFSAASTAVNAGASLRRRAPVGCRDAG